MYIPMKTLIDPGFDVGFDDSRIDQFCSRFSEEGNIRAFVESVHRQENAFDLKRGEYYPELLRAIIGLKNALASLYEIDPTQVQPNFGSNGSIDTILTAVAIRQVSKDQPKGGVVMTSPTYFRNYNSASARELHIHLVPLRTDLSLDTETFIDVIREKRPGVIMLVTPNNPTGIPIPDEDLLRILDSLDDKTWAVVDRTLANIKPEIATVNLLQRYRDKQVIILHSFSKYKGLSHLRIGVALHTNAASALAVQPFLPLGIGLEGALKAQRFVRLDQGIVPSTEIIDNIIYFRKAMDAWVARRPKVFSISDFAGNYGLLLFNGLYDAATLSQGLKRHGVYVMGGSEFPEPNHRQIRLHTGAPPAYVERLCQALEQECATVVE